MKKFIEVKTDALEFGDPHTVIQPIREGFSRDCFVLTCRDDNPYTMQPAHWVNSEVWHEMPSGVGFVKFPAPEYAYVYELVE